MKSSELQQIYFRSRRWWHAVSVGSKHLNPKWRETHILRLTLSVRNLFVRSQVPLILESNGAYRTFIIVKISNLIQTSFYPSKTFHLSFIRFSQTLQNCNLNQESLWNLTKFSPLDLKTRNFIMIFSLLLFEFYRVRSTLRLVGRLAYNVITSYFMWTPQLLQTMKVSASHAEKGRDSPPRGNLFVARATFDVWGRLLGRSIKTGRPPKWKLCIEGSRG